MISETTQNELKWLVAAEILNLSNQIKDKLPDTNVSISGVTVRKDKASVKY
jgi:hypothetical protein